MQRGIRGRGRRRLEFCVLLPLQHDADCFNVGHLQAEGDSGGVTLSFLTRHAPS